MIVNSSAPYSVMYVNQPWARLYSDGDPDQQQDPEWFTRREAISCLNIPPADSSVVKEEVMRVLARAASGIPSRVAFSRTRKNGSLALSYAKFLPIARDDGVAGSLVLVILHEFEAAKTAVPRESGVVYPTPSGTMTAAGAMRSSNSAVRAWDMMNMHVVGHGLPHPVPVAVERAQFEGAIGGFEWEQQPSLPGGSSQVTPPYFQTAAHVSAPPSWLIQQTNMDEETSKVTGSAADALP